MKHIKTFILFALILIIGLIAFYPNQEERKYPYFAYTDSMSISGYTFADEHGDILEQFDCTCGCYEHIGHNNLRDCYIFEGSFEAHASYCDTCKALNQKVQIGYNKGLTIEEIKRTL